MFSLGCHCGNSVVIIGFLNETREYVFEKRKTHRSYIVYVIAAL